MKPPDSLVEPLTKREIEILTLLAANQTNSEIAQALNLSLNSVKWYARQIYSKLGTRDRREAAARAKDLGLLVTSQDAPAETLTHHPLPSGTVTFLFTDIEGSTPLWEQMPKEMEISLAQHHAILRKAIESNNGQVFQIIGDEFQAAFRLATQALEAALDAQRCLQSAKWGATGPIKVRMGLHTGPAELDLKGDAPYAVSHTLNRAGRVRSAAYGGQVLLSQETKDLVERELPEGMRLKDLGQCRLKGLAVPERLFQVCTPDLPDEFPALAAALTTPNNLPPELTSFIGREGEIEHLKQILCDESCRYITLTGSGGTGKTRLALRVAQKEFACFPDGIWLVELAPLSDPSQVVKTVAQVLGLQEITGVPILETLSGYLKNRRLLILLDNCEHLLTECARLVDTLLRACPMLHILATSREILNVPGETSFRVPSLALPDAGQLPPLHDLAQVESVRLFVERASQAAPGFVLEESDARDVAGICQRLDGIPLAIELASTRVRVMPVHQIASRLDNVFRLLTGGSRTAQTRQQTLRATIDWSYALLKEPEKLAMRRLSVFAGSWTLEAAEAVCTGEGIASEDVLDLLAGLVDKSLVILSMPAGGEGRYRMLETIRQYAREKLLESGEGEAARNRHLDYYLHFCEAVELHLRGSEQVQRLNQLEEELDNLRLALQWSLTGRILTGIQIASSLMWFWHIHPHEKEGIQWLENLFELELEAQGNQPLQVGVQSESYLLTWVKGVNALVFHAAYQHASFKMERMKAMLAEGIALSRAIGSSANHELAWGLSCMAAYTDQDNESAIQLLEESLQICRKNQFRFEEAEAMMILFECECLKEDFQKAREYIEPSLAICRQLGDPDGIATRLSMLGVLNGIEGNFIKAKKMIEEGRVYYRENGNRWGYHIYVNYLLCFSQEASAMQQGEEALAFFREILDQRSLLLTSATLTRIYWVNRRFSKVWRLGREILDIHIENIHKYKNDWIRDDVSFKSLYWFPRLTGQLYTNEQYRQLLSTFFSWIKEKQSVFVYDLAEIMDMLFILIYMDGYLLEAVKGFGAVSAVYSQFEQGMIPIHRSEHDQSLACLHLELSEAVFQAAWEEGRQMDLAQAIQSLLDADCKFEEPALIEKRCSRVREEGEP